MDSEFSRGNKTTANFLLTLCSLLALGRHFQDAFPLYPLFAYTVNMLKWKMNKYGDDVKGE
jgi:hypothetical protein